MMAKAIWFNLLKVWSFFRIFCFLLADYLDWLSQWMWLVSCRRQRCWLKGLQEIPSVSWIFHNSLHLHIHYTASFLPRISWALCCCWKWCGNGKVQGGGGAEGRGVHLVVFDWGDRGCITFFQGVSVLLLIVLTGVVYDSCCVCFFVPFFCFLCLWSL